MKFFVQWIHSSTNDIWNQFFNGYNPTNHTTDTVLVSQTGNFHVHDVLFTNHKTQLIKLTNNDNNRLLISNSVFNSNQGIYSNGGNIRQNKGQIVQYRICSINIIINNYAYSRSYIMTTEDQACKNYLIKSSITGSQGKEGLTGIFMMNIYYQVAIFANFNFK